jgi:pSer/pThr/pTyr-binding forkhead associated (FHA) protein
MVLFRKTKGSSEAERIVQLTIIDGNKETKDNPGKTFTLQCGNNFIGRDPLCEVILNSGTVSRKHANLKVNFDKTKYIIMDLGSSNGVLVKPSSVLRKGKKAIESGDEFQVGEILMKLYILDDEESLQTMTVDIQEIVKQAKKQVKEQKSKKKESSS